MITWYIRVNDGRPCRWEVLWASQWSLDVLIGLVITSQVYGFPIVNISVTFAAEWHSSVVDHTTGFTETALGVVALDQHHITTEFVVAARTSFEVRD